MDDNKIEFLQFPSNIRARVGMYLGSNQRDGLNTALRELTDNACDEVGAGYGDTVHISNNLGGYCYVADNSQRGMPIRMSKDVPDRTEAYLSISELHTSGKFKVGDIGRVGLNGVGSSAVNATSLIYALLVRITEKNYKDSIPEVEKAWKEVGPRQKNELYYVVICEKGYKKFESCLLLKDIEKMLYGKKSKPIIPRGMTTLVLFKSDPEIFECDNLVPDIPYTNLNYFLLIQQRFFGRKKVRVLVDGEDLKCNFKPFKFEIATTIKPKDSESPNKEVGIYLTLEADPELGKTDKDMFASVNGLDCKTGFHVNLARTAFKSAIRSQFKITHEYALEGLRFGIIILANECVFSSQTKENLKAITKVKLDDFTPLVKEIEKIFKKNIDYWNLHFEKVNQFWDAHRNIGAADKAQKMIDATSGVSSYRAKADYPKTFADATSKDRSQCELFLVEGNSAQSSLVMGRKDTRYHACLGLRGKILNVTDKSVDRALESKVINDIFNIIGLGLDVNWVGKDAKTFDEAHEIIMKRSRFSKIIIATDADADGSAIFNEIVYLFSKFARFLITHKMVYRAMSPLFRGYSKTTGKVTYYYPDDSYDIKTGFPLDLDTKKHYDRWKGLSSLTPETGEVYDSFYNPATRRLILVTPEGMDYSMKLNEDINERKKLLYNKGILSNPYNFTDI